MALTRIRARVAALETAAATTTEGTRRRVVPMIAASLLCLVGLQRLVSSGVVAVYFTTTDTPTMIATNYLTGLSAAAYLDPQKHVSGPDAVVELGVKDVRLSGLCALAEHSFAGVKYTLMLTAGAPVADPTSGTGASADGAGNAIRVVGGSGSDAGDLSLDQSSPVVLADRLFLSASALDAYAYKLSGLVIGRNASTVAAAAGLDGTVGDAAFRQSAVDGAFGVTVDHLNLSGVDANSYGIHLKGTLKVPSLKVQMLTGSASSNRDKCDSEASS
ncbi:MAG: DUF6230 family protein [Nocardioides sp.]|uniref:DUF6230 family protein n=1 Tax=Nocardioides sp. TaxID=35761 RepID=UPI0039E6AE7E